MWISNARNNFAPFAGLMLVGFEKTISLGNGEHLDEIADVGAADDTADSKTNDVPV